MMNLLAVHGQRKDSFKELEKELETILEVTNAPGFAVAIVKGTTILYSKGFGYRDYENKKPADANTLYPIGSCTKAFTSSILGQLQFDNKISLNAKPSNYISDFNFFNDEMNNYITIKDLMTHRTGLPRHDFSWYLFPTKNRDSLLGRIKYQEPLFGVREQWFYNNFMFLVQGVIAERVTGLKWENLIKERFFTPLNMSRSNISIEELNSSTNIAYGYKLTSEGNLGKVGYHNFEAMSPAGSINSSVNDMANWLITWINKGKYNGEQILPPSYIDEAISSQMVVSSSLPENVLPSIHLLNYGYAWFISSYKGHYQVEHGGNIDGFSSNVTFFPSDSIGIVVLTNQHNSPVPNLVRNTIADRLLKSKKTDWIKGFTEQNFNTKDEKDTIKKEATQQKIMNNKPSHIISDYVGGYIHPGYGEFQITNQNDSLFINFKLKKMFLKHLQYDIFETSDLLANVYATNGNSIFHLNFDTDLEGNISLVRIQMESALDHPIVFKYKPHVIDLNKKVLENYVGDFYLNETLIKIGLKNDDILFLYVKGQPPYELVPTGKNNFSFKNTEGYRVEFIESDNHSINEIILIQPNGKFSALKK